MKAIQFHALGDPSVLQYEDVADPVAGEGELVVRVHAAGINFADTLFRRGRYFVRPVFPQIPGMEAAGAVESIGPGTTGVRVGDRVMVVTGTDSYAERIVCKPHHLFPLPDAVSFEAGAALPIQGLTAHHLLTLCARMQKAETVLVHAAAGGVGSLAVQLARKLGASRIFGTAGSAEKLDLVQQLGAHVALNYRSDDVGRRILEETDGRGVDVILEMVGGTESFKKNLACLAPFGRMIVYGAAGGDVHGTIEPVGLMAKNHSVIGYYLTPLMRHRELCAPPLAELADEVAAGKLRVIIGGTYPLADAAKAHADMEKRGTTGKLVLLP